MPSSRRWNCWLARPSFWYFFRDDPGPPADPDPETRPEKGFLKERVLIMLFTRISVSSFGTERIDWSTSMSVTSTSSTQLSSSEASGYTPWHVTQG